MKCLIDGDILVYRSGFAAQQTIYKFVHKDGQIEEFPDMSRKEVIQDLKARKLTKADGKLQKAIRPDPIEFACHTLKLMLRDILEAMGTEEYDLLLTSNDKSNYRFEVATTQPYKGNRKQPKPYHYDALRSYMSDVWGAITVSGMEADDSMGIRQVAASEDTVICSIDKDMHMIPGYHYNFVTKEKKHVDDPGYLELQRNNRKLVGGGVMWFYAQMLLGDSADNIPGVKGYGPVKAFYLLSKETSERKMCHMVYKVYKKKKIEDRFFEVADLLWIQRYPNERKSEELMQWVP